MFKATSRVKVFSRVRLEALNYRKANIHRSLGGARESSRGGFAPPWVCLNSTLPESIYPRLNINEKSAWPRLAFFVRLDEIGKVIKNFTLVLYFDVYITKTLGCSSQLH